MVEIQTEMRAQVSFRISLSTHLDTTNKNYPWQLIKSVHIPHVSGIWCCPAFERHRSCLLCAQILQPRFHLCKHQRSTHRLPHACGPSGPASCHFEEALEDGTKTFSWYTGIFFSASSFCRHFNIYYNCRANLSPQDMTTYCILLLSQF